MHSLSPTTETQLSQNTGARLPSRLVDLSWQDIAALARIEADGEANEQVVSELSTDRLRWRNVLVDMIEASEDRLHSVRRLKGPQRNQIIVDFESELSLLTQAYRRATGQAYELEEEQGEVEPLAPDTPPEPTVLQLSWTSGRVIAWAAGAHSHPETTEQVMDRLVKTGAPASAWEDHRNISLPGGATASAVSAEVTDILGWLAALSTQPWTDPSLSVAADDASAQEQDHLESEKDFEANNSACNEWSRSSQSRLGVGLSLAVSAGGYRVE